MRKDVKKFLFLGMQEQKEAFFAAAQEAGLIHFIDPQSKTKKEYPLEIQQLIDAIKILRSLPVTEQEENFDLLEPHFKTNVQTILELNKSILNLQEDLRLLDLEISRVSILGDFSLEDIAAIEKEGNCVIQFFGGRASLFDDRDLPENLIEIKEADSIFYYMSVNSKQTHYEGMFEVKVEKSLQDLKQAKNAKQHMLQKAEKELKSYASYQHFFHEKFIEALNLYHLFDAQTYVNQVMDETLFAVEGWVPANHIQSVYQLADSYSIVTEEIAIESEDIVPTYLENKGVARLGEDLVDIYDTPSSHDKDPSLWVLGGFALFFAIIIGDAGYGLVYLCLALFLRYKYPLLTGLKKRALNLFTFLSLSCIVWGILATSFFGIAIDKDNPIRQLSLVQWLATKKLAYHMENYDEIYQGFVTNYPDLESLDDVQDVITYIPSAKPEQGMVVLSRINDHIMFELALFIGIVHLITSLLRYGKRTPPNLGWVAFLIGAYLYFAAYLQAPTLLNYVAGIDLSDGGAIGWQLMIGGIGFAWLTSIIINGWKGVFEVMNLIQVFADTLSYLRLYALGLAGAIVAATINEIAATLPTVIAVILILFSHLINLVLGTMSGVIHGLRLNFLEWYHYSFEGGGKQFKPLKLLKNH